MPFWAHGKAFSQGFQPTPNRRAVFLSHACPLPTFRPETDRQRPLRCAPHRRAQAPAFSAAHWPGPGQLVEEGRHQHNCVGGYAERVAGGKVFIYRVLRPDQATLSLRLDTDGEWVIGQLLRAFNQPVSTATAVTVQLWLAGESVWI